MECTRCRDTGSYFITMGDDMVEREMCDCYDYNVTLNANLSAQQHSVQVELSGMYDIDTALLVEAVARAAFKEGVAFQKTASNPTKEKAATNL